MEHKTIVRSSRQGFDDDVANDVAQGWNVDSRHVFPESMEFVAFLSRGVASPPINENPPTAGYTLDQMWDAVHLGKSYGAKGMSDLTASAKFKEWLDSLGKPAISGNDKPRPSNELLWRCWLQAKGGRLSGNQEVDTLPEFKKFLETLPPDPLEGDRELVKDSYLHASWLHNKVPTIEMSFSDENNRNNFDDAMKMLLGVEVGNG